MRLLKILAALTVTCLLVLAPTAAAQTQPFSASFKGKQTRNDPPCAGGALFCGTGSVAGYGAATFSIVPTGIGPPSGRCQPVTALTTIALTSGAGSLTITAAGDVCFPGNSTAAPGQLHAFGNPFSIAATFDVIGGTGVFAGAGGGGTATLRGAGAQTKLTASGVLEL
jgi:hypothetical protein